MGRSAQRHQEGGRRPGDSRGAERPVGLILPRRWQSVTIATSMPREQIAQLAQGGGEVEAGVGQRFAGHDFLQRGERRSLAGQHHLGAPFGHVANVAVARAGGDHDLDAVQRVRPGVLAMVRQLVLGQRDALGLGQRRAGQAVEHQPVAGLAGVAADSAPVVLGGNGNLHEFPWSQ